jgi:hypothetical protein
MNEYYLKRNLVLSRAQALINGDRQEEYGPPNKNFKDIAVGWSIIFDKEVEPFEVALAMDWVKTCRALKSPELEDSWIDKAGYSAIGAELVGEYDDE